MHKHFDTRLKARLNQMCDNEETITVRCSVCGNNVEGHMVGLTPVAELHSHGPLGTACPGSGCLAYTTR